MMMLMPSMRRRLSLLLPSTSSMITSCRYTCLFLLLALLREQNGARAWELKTFRVDVSNNKYSTSATSKVLSSFPVTYHFHSASSSSLSKKSSNPILPFLRDIKFNQKKQLPPILCIHPVGVGLASWYYKKLARIASEDARDVYAINLPGCGSMDLATIRATGGEAADDDDADVYWNAFSSLALSDKPQLWVDACQALIDQVILSSSSKQQPLLNQQSCQLLVQGGLAPIGVTLAAQNGPRKISSLVLTSPPTWTDMTTAVPMKEVQFNYDFLKSPVFGKLAFGLLESRWAIKVFSNAFLFQEPCDDEWLDQTLEEACPQVRPPVQAFNAGVCVLKSYDKELASLRQPTLILQGESDTRQRMEGRLAYLEGMSSSLVVLETLPGKSLLPWESPSETWSAIQQFTAGIKG